MPLARGGFSRTWACLLALFLLLPGSLMAQKAKKGGGGTAKPFKVETITNSVGMTFVKIPAGSFMMGNASGPMFERPVHRVAISEPFYMQNTEVTQGQWQAVMGTRPWEGKEDVREGADFPAVYVSWEDAQLFIEKMNQKEGETYQLPTEAEWEYACRAGTTSKFSFGNDESRLVDFAWFTANTEEKGEKYAHPVKLKQANPWGLFDMHGNVMEWCEDWFGDYPKTPQKDPLGAFTGEYKVVRGSAWYCGAGALQSGQRGYTSPKDSNGSLGFRLVVSKSSN